jgi:hypothetical protein
MKARGIEGVGARVVLPTIAPRQMTVAPSSIPAYASPCSGSFHYSSACSCVGVTAMTTTVATPTTTTTTTTSTTVTVVPTLIAIQFLDDTTCQQGLNDQTTTPAPLGVCVDTTASNSADFSSFEGGPCTPSECSVNFYGDFGCTGVIKNVPVTLDICYDFSVVYAIELICPTCP